MPLISRAIRCTRYVPRAQCLKRFSTGGPSLLRPRPRPMQLSERQITIGIALGTLGVVTVGYACYNVYTTWRDTFPPEVRSDLKHGIRAKNRGDFEHSAYYKRKAWNTAIGLPIEEFKAEPYLKITGIAVDLAGELEEQGKTQEAFGLYREAFDLIRRSPPELLSGPERLRAVSLAVRLGQQAKRCALPIEEEEIILVWAVEEILKLLIETQGTSSAGEASRPLDFTHLNLPNWLTKEDVAVPLQMLGGFYGRFGKLEYAIPLYLQGITALVSDNGAKALPENMCQGAFLMNNISELIIRGDPTAERQKHAEAWAQKALSILHTARKEAKEPISICEQVLYASLFNAGILRELAGDHKNARTLYVSASEQAKSSGIDAGVTATAVAIARLDTKPP